MPGETGGLGGEKRVIRMWDGHDAMVAGAGFGISVGHATDAEGATGCTVIRGTNHPMRASAFALGRATGTRESQLLEPWASNDRIDAVLLTGGSAYGLAAAAGVMRWMEERGRGYAIGGGVVPIVPAAVVFDLAPLGAFAARPTAQMAYEACDRATPSGWDEGSVGAGTGCTVGKVYGPAHAVKGGLGIALAGDMTASGGTVSACAIAVVNAVGHIRDTRTGAIIAGARDPAGGLADSEAVGYARGFFADPAANTTLSLVALNRTYAKVDLHRIARAASAAHARRIGPAGTAFDGDIVFAVCPLDAEPGDLIRAELAATAALEEAIVRGVRAARGREGVPGLADGPP